MTESAARTNAPSRLGMVYPLLAIAVGVLLLALAVGIVQFGLDLPLVRLLVYCGVAALFVAIGSTAAINLKLKPLGQAGTATGAVAAAVLLSWTIGGDPPSRLDMIRYINFPGASVQPMNPSDFTATIEVVRDGKSVGEPTPVPVFRAPGGDTLKIAVSDLFASDSIIIRMHNKKAQKSWASAAVPPTEGFMNLNEEPDSGP